MAGDENLSEAVAGVLEQLAHVPEIRDGSFKSGVTFTVTYNAPPKSGGFVIVLHPDDPVCHFVDCPAWTVSAKVTATYENSYAN
mgnify:CR=1 FL=1